MHDADFFGGALANLMRRQAVKTILAIKVWNHGASLGDFNERLGREFMIDDHGGGCASMQRFNRVSAIQIQTWGKSSKSSQMAAARDLM